MSAESVEWHATFNRCPLVPLARAAMLPCLVCLHVHIGALFAAVTQFSRSARLVNSIDGSALNLQQLPHWRCMPRKFTSKFMHYLHIHIVYFRVSFSFNVFHFVVDYLWQRDAEATHSCPGLAKSRLSCGASCRIDMYVDKATGQAAKPVVFC